MKVAISGSTGFIGKHLSEFLRTKGAGVVSLKHSLFDTADAGALYKALEGCDVVVNLAGAPINQRWTDASKKEIICSRLNATNRLVEVMNGMEVKPKTFVSISAVGIYPSKVICTEEHGEYGTTFLSDVCIQWELAAQKISRDVRLVIPRFGVVLGNDGGALPKMLLPFKLFLGGRIASGNQGFSWIHINDLLAALYLIMQDSRLSGVFNFTAPQLLTNRDFAYLAARELHRPNWLHLPEFVFRMLYGEGHIVVTDGQQVYPDRLLNEGYRFKYDKLYLALQSLIH